MKHLALAPGRAALALLLACAPASVAPPPEAPSPGARPPGAPPPDLSDMSPGPAKESPPTPSSAPSDPPPTPSDPPPTPPRPDPRVRETGSVHPGINAPYRAPGAVRTWSRRFERDGREVHDHQAQIVAALGLQPGMAVADVGAGTGLFTLAFAAAVGPGGAVYAVDLIPEFLAHIATKSKQAGFTQVQLVRASERSSELPPGSVDLVFMSDAYHHLEYPQHVLATLHAALRPGGSLWVIDFKRDEHSDAALRRHVRADRAQVLEELARAGFELVDEPLLLRENYVLHLRPRP